MTDGVRDTHHTCPLLLVPAPRRPPPVINPMSTANVLVDNVDPAEEHSLLLAQAKAAKVTLRKYEKEFEAREGKKPRTRAEWGPMWPEYQRYAALREQAKGSPPPATAAEVLQATSRAQGLPADAEVEEATNAPAQRI